MKKYRFKKITKGGKKGQKGQTKSVRIGARSPGNSSGIGTIRHPH